MPGTPLSLRLDKYVIHEEPGRGGFGAVYRATDTSLYNSTTPYTLRVSYP